MRSVIMPVPNFWWSQYPSVSMIYTSEAGWYLTVHGLRADPSGLVRPLPLSSTRLRLVLIPLGSLEARGGGSSIDDTIPRDSGVQKVNYLSVVCP